MPRIPRRPASTSATGQFPADIVVDQLVARFGDVIDTTDVATFAAANGLRDRYVRDALGLHTELGLVEQPRRGLWIVPPGPGELDRVDPLRAYVATRISGPWNHVVGAWALVIRRHIDVMPPDALRTCATPRPAKPQTEHRPHADPERPLPVALRHVTQLLGAPITSIARPIQFMTPCDWIRLDSGSPTNVRGAHVERAADALVTMFEHPRLNGGVDAGLTTVGSVIRDDGLQAVVEAALRTRHISTRRRVAFALAQARAAEPTLDRLALRDERVSQRTLAAWLDDELHRLLFVGRTRSPALADPHRMASGHLIRRIGLVDNRRAPLQHCRVTEKCANMPDDASDEGPCTKELVGMDESRRPAHHRK